MCGKGVLFSSRGSFAYGEWQDGIKRRDISAYEIDELNKMIDKCFK